MALRRLIGSMQNLAVSSLAGARPLNIYKSCESQLKYLWCFQSSRTKHGGTFADLRAAVDAKEKNRRNVPWVPFKEKYEYTVEPLPMPKTGGRGPDGRVQFKRRGGGHKRRFRMIDWHRQGADDGTPVVERVHKIMYDPNRSGRIALVVNGDKKRYVMATHNMAAGDLIKSSSHIPRMVVQAKDGDAHPLGALPIGTLISSVAKFPGAGGRIAVSAGTSAQLVRKIDGRCIVRMPSGREMNVAQTCTATVGRISNIDHDKRVIGKAGRNRWLGIRPKSGLWQRKTGRFGRKIKPIKKAIIYDKLPVLLPKPRRMGLV